MLCIEVRSNRWMHNVILSFVLEVVSPQKKRVTRSKPRNWDQQQPLIYLYRVSRNYAGPSHCVTYCYVSYMYCPSIISCLYMSYKILLYLYKYLHFCEIVSTPTGFSTNSRIKFCETIGWFGFETKSSREKIDTNSGDYNWCSLILKGCTGGKIAIPPVRV